MRKKKTDRKDETELSREGEIIKTKDFIASGVEQ